MDEIEQGQIQDVGGGQQEPRLDRIKEGKQGQDRNEGSRSSSVDSDKQAEQKKKQKQKSKAKKVKKAKKAPRSNEIISSNYRTKKCQFYMKGACAKGDTCEFSHNFEVEKSKKLCRFFMSGHCSKGSSCFFNHDTSTYPCRFYHLEKQCKAGEECRFSHGPIPEGELEDFLKDNLDLLTNMYRSMRLENEPVRQRLSQVLKQFVESKLAGFTDINKQTPTMPQLGKLPQNMPAAYSNYPSPPPTDATQYWQHMPHPNAMWNRQQYSSMPPMMNGHPQFGYGIQQPHPYSYGGPFPNNAYQRGGYPSPMHAPQIPSTVPLSMSHNIINRNYPMGIPQRQTPPVGAFNPAVNVAYPIYQPYSASDWPNTKHMQTRQSNSLATTLSPQKESISISKAQNLQRQLNQQTPQQTLEKPQPNKSLEKFQNVRNSKKPTESIIENQPNIPSSIPQAKMPVVKSSVHSAQSKRLPPNDDPLLRGLRTFLDYRY